MMVSKFALFVVAIIVSIVSSSQNQPSRYDGSGFDDYNSQKPPLHAGSYPLPTSPTYPPFGTYPSANEPYGPPPSLQQQQSSNPYGPLPQGRYPPQMSMDRMGGQNVQRSLVPFGSRGSPNSYGQQQQQQQQEGGGLFSKLRSGLAAAGAALTGLDSQNNDQQQQQHSSQYPPRNFPPRPPGPPSFSNPNNPQRQYSNIPNVPGSRFPPPPGGFGGNMNTRSAPNQNEEGSLLGKIKSLFSSDDQQQNKQDFRPRGVPNYNSVTPPRQSSPPYDRNNPSLSSSSSSSYDQTTTYQDNRFSNPTYPSYSNQYQPPQSSSTISGSDNTLSTTSLPKSNQYSTIGSSMPYTSDIHSQGSNVHMSGDIHRPADPFQPPSMSNFSPSEEFPPSYSSFQNHMKPDIRTIDPSSLIPPEPQVFVVEDCIVFIAKPKEFYRKKMLMTMMGAPNLQVFTDFEHVFSKFKSEDGNRALGTAESLENSPALSPQAITRLRSIAEEFNSRTDMDATAFEDFTNQCQTVIAKEGGLHIANVPPLTRDALPRMPLREGWKEMIQALATTSVPLYIFSSGYGDLTAQILLQSGISTILDQQGSTTNPSNSYSFTQTPSITGLPQNLRIISNFFRTGPDGTVRAFSNPIVHERNKNATTAAKHMGMPLPERPHAIVIGSHEDDVTMTDGLQGLKEQLSIGYLELTEDLPQRITTFLNAFDAVVVGDSSLQYCKSLIQEILQITDTSTKSNNKNNKGGGKLSFFDRSLLGGFASVDLM